MMELFRMLRRKDTEGVDETCAGRDRSTEKGN